MSVNYAARWYVLNQSVSHDCLNSRAMLYR